MNEPEGPFGSKLVLRSSVSDTARLHAWLDRAFVAAPTPDPLQNAVRLCLEEAVMNTITHGYGEGTPGEIEITLSRTPSGLRATLTDSAPPFDPAAAPVPPARRPGLHEGPLGGRGLRLMRQFAASIEYRRSGGRNQLTMHFAD